MSFLAIQKDDLTDDEAKFQRGESKIFFSPLPSLKFHEYPALWMDLHLSGDGYEICGEDKKLKFKNAASPREPGPDVRFNRRIGISYG